MQFAVRVVLVWALLAARAALAADAGCPPQDTAFTPEMFSQAAAQARDRGFLWSLTKDDRVSYLYGTLHVGKAEWMAPGPSVRQALRETGVLAFEMDPTDPAIHRELAAGLAQVKRILPEPLQQRVAAAWRVQCLPPAALQSMPPELQVVTLMVSTGMKDGITPAYGSEMLLATIGRALRRPIVSLESPAQQLQALLARDDAEAAGFVRDSLDDLEQGKVGQVMRKTLDVWARADLASLQAYTSWCECADTAVERALLKRLLDDRNPALAQRIDGLHMQGQKVFAAVGALHMTGPASLTTLLAAMGYRVDRMH